MQVDPDNRLVAGSLEAEWNQALRALAEAKERYEKQRQADREGFNDEQRAALSARALPSGSPAQSSSSVAITPPL